MNRRGFIKFLGIGTAATVASPAIIPDAAIMASRMPSKKKVKRNGIKLTAKATGLAVNPGQTLTFVGEKGSRKMVPLMREK